MLQVQQKIHKLITVQYVIALNTKIKLILIKIFLGGEGGGGTETYELLHHSVLARNQFLTNVSVINLSLKIMQI